MVLGINQARRKIVIKRITDAYVCAKKCLTDEAFKDRFLSWCDRLPGIAEEFDSVHNKIISKLNPDDEEEFNLEDQYRQTFDETYSDILEIKLKVFGPESNNNRNSNSNGNNIPESRHRNDNQPQVKLPRISLPSFDGNYKDFLAFRDLFETVVHNNKSLSNVEKFSYLLSSLQGHALELLKAFPLSDANYEIAYKTLLSRYENKRQLAFISWEAIINYKLIAQDATSLRKLLDIFSENLAILKTLDLPVDQWDFLLFHTLLTKLDISTRKEFEMSATSTEIPSFAQLNTFLAKYCQAWERSSSTLDTSDLPPKRINKKQNSNNKADSPATTTLLAGAGKDNYCNYCSGEHFIRHCHDFQLLSVHQRYETVKNRNWCINCLRPNHISQSCRSRSNCQQCGRRHHTLLHFDSAPPSVPAIKGPPSPSPPPAENASAPPPPPVNVLTNTKYDNKTVILSTAKVEVLNKWGTFEEVRVLLDSGSQAHFMTDTCARRLGISKSRCAVPIFGLGNQEVHDLGKIQCTMRPRGGLDPILTIEAVVVPRICGDMPSTNIETNAWMSFKGITFADPTCLIPGPIDMLLGAEVWPDILLPGSIRATDTSPMALNTVFGWVLMGSVPCTTPSQVNSLLAITDQNLSSVIQRLWEVENIPDDPPTSVEDALCEDIFSKTHHRDEKGRYTVELPLKTEISYKGMRAIALRKFYACENRLLQKPELYKAYTEFMQDYLNSNHMTLIPDGDMNRSDAYYIPHHGVINENSSTTRLRVVFNASDTDTEGQSLNKNQFIGPKLQTDIAAILLRFRLHNIVLTTDIRQMYRQILVSDKHRHLQRILWRFNPSQPVAEYELNTVTYGVSSSPFLALRVVQQLVEDEGAAFPLAAEVLKRDIYVDDICSGAPTLEKARELQHQLTGIMSKGCFELRKWASNDPKLLEHLPETHRLSKSQCCDLDQDNFIKVLGLQWDPETDNFVYKVQPLNRTCSKRTMLSELARIFDPLGLLAPLTFLAKCLIQKLWLLGTDWDEDPPTEITEVWERYVSQLPQLSQLSIPRHVTHADAINCQMHGFGDASEAGYGAVVYLRFELSDGSIRTHLICAKSKVAPIKRWTLPRLELAAAVLLVDLLNYVLSQLLPLLSPQDIIAWSDSMITLAWIQSLPTRWKTFIANRVSHIQRTLPQAQWKYVDTKSNPADCVSRGLLPEQILNHSLWLHGPEWLLQSQEHWPSTPISSPTKFFAEEEQRKSVLLTEVHRDEIENLLFRFSSLKKIQRIVVYMLRFINRARKVPGLSGAITTQEMEDALHIVVLKVQSKTFAEDLNNLRNHKSLTKPMRRLCPFLDTKSLLRVGGRLINAPVEYDVRHPVLLPNNHRLTDLIIQDVHESHLHPGPQTVQFLVSQKFWILAARRAIKRCLSKCIRCFRTNPIPAQPLMAPLPSHRVSGVKAFAVVGCDYAGPFNVIVGKRKRGVRSQKMYLCVFVCFATKALHLEIVNDLTSEAFIAALRRFIGRRGRCSQLISDCGTNFVGAYRQLVPLMETAAQREYISFQTHPPSAPHFSGLAEAGVKSVKSHLNRVIGTQLLTFEELHTLIIQIEAVLNSRPLCASSNDPNDLSVLTPGHFLTLEPMTAVPVVPENELALTNRWHHLQRLHHDFWRRWYHDYLNSLMQRNKWTVNTRGISIGDLVVIKEDDEKPMRWRLGRIIRVHPGSDGVIRVATVRTQSGTMKRPAVKLCPLPLYD